MKLIRTKGNVEIVALLVIAVVVAIVACIIFNVLGSTGYSGTMGG